MEKFTPSQIKTTKDFLSTFKLIDGKGANLNDTIKPGQLEIATCLINRKGPGGQKKIHIMAHTRYGKSITVGACVAIRASVKKEPWTIVAPTEKQAQIIMDYVIYFSVNDPIIRQLLTVDAKVLKSEVANLTQRRSRNHLTYKNGGEVRVFSVTQTMGFGCPNLVMDEACRIGDNDEALAYRMLGDSPDNFLVKIGNPFFNNHFKTDYLDTDFHHINIDVEQGIREGRFTEEENGKVKAKPNYGILYLNQFPDDEERDKYGYKPIFTHKLIEATQTDTGEHVGQITDALDPADGGANASVIVRRSSKYAEILMEAYSLGVADACADLIQKGKDSNKLAMDIQGLGRSDGKRLQTIHGVKERFVPLNTALPVPDVTLMEGMRQDEFENYRAYLIFAFERWLQIGGKLQRDERWKNLLHFRWKNSKRGRLQVVSKEELQKYYGVKDMGVGDAATYTCTPEHPQSVMNPDNPNNQDLGGIDPYYPEIGV